MLRLRHLLTVLSAALLCAALLAPAALGAEGVGRAKKLGGGETTVTTSATRTNSGSGSTKETLSVATKSPAAGTTLSGSVVWEVSVLAGAPSKVEFAVDGSVQATDTSAPYGVSLDTTKLSNGSHTLSATASGAKGVKATTQVTVKVSNTVTTPAPEPTPTPTPEPEPTPTPTPSPASGPIYWGATIGSHLTGNQAPWDMNAVTKFEEGAKKKVSMVQFFQPFANCNPGCSFYKFPTSPMESIRTHGSIPVLSWSSQSIPSLKEEPDFQLSDVISGRYDTYIREFATQAKNWNHPYFLRFNWEMNGRWFPWHEGVNGNQAGESVKAWRHVHDIFTAVGVHQRDLDLVPERRVQRQHLAGLALPRRLLRRLDLHRRLQLGHQPGQARQVEELRPGLQADLPEDRGNDRPRKADDDRRGRLQRVRRLEGDLDQGHAGQDPGRLPADPRPPLVRQIRQQHGLAGRDHVLRRRRLCRRAAEPRLRGELLQQSRGHRCSAAELVLRD